MKLDADNPMLTAFALGELDEPERAEIEAHLAHDEAARKLVDEIRASALLVTQELKTERAPGLTDKQQAAIYARHSAPAAKKPSFWRPLAAAAMLLFTVGIVGLMTAQRAPQRDAYERGGNSFTMSPPAQSVTESNKPTTVDHFETINVDEETQAAKEGATLDKSHRGKFRTPTDSVETTKSSFRNQTSGTPDPIDETGTFAGHGTGKKVPPAEQPAATKAPATGPVTAVILPESESKSSFARHVDEKPRDFADYQKLEPAVGTVTGASDVGHSQPKTDEKTTTGDKKERDTKEEIENLKRQIEELRNKARNSGNTVSSGKTSTDKELSSLYGPNAPDPTKLKEKMSVGGLTQVETGYKIEDKNGFKKKADIVSYNGDLNSIVVPNPQPQPAPAPGTETYATIAESGFKRVTDEPLSTFSIDVDTASYANVRRFLNQGQMPPRDAVRIEEMLNYFSYNYGQPQGDDPFAIHVEVAQCPWNTTHRLARVGVKGREFAENKRPAGNYVFLIDVSGSMDEPKKRPLVQSGLSMLVDKLGENDRVGIVTYAGEASVSLPSTPCSDKRTIKNVIGGLRAAGSTNGGDGIQRAYKMATENFIKGGINRVILCTDGDFNVGVTDPNQLVKLIEEQAKSGVFLSVLGFGMGDLKDATMQKLADKGNGNYAYIDSLDEVRKVLVDQMTATLATIAKDVKIQVEFNPAVAGAYRLIGYEKRLLNKQDFNNDKVDAGEVGAGHQVTALYEIVPASALESEPGVDPLIYQKNPQPKPAGANGDLLTLKIRYKQPDGETSKLIKGAVADNGASYAQASKDFKFAAAIAAFGMLLRESPYRGNTSFDAVLELADEARGKDEGGYRREFLGLVEKARAMLKR